MTKVSEKPYRLSGVISAVPTPIDVNGEPDTKKLISFCRQLLSTGCHGVNLLGTTGEATSFDVPTRLHVMQEVAKDAGLSRRMMVGTGATSLEDTLTLTKAADSLGFSGALLLPPFFYPDVTDEGLFDYFVHIVNEVQPKNASFYLYNIPQNTGIRFSPELVRRLHAACPGAIVGLKDSSGDLVYAAALAQQNPGFDVFPSNEATLADSHSQGYAGCISASVNVAPWLAREIYEAQSKKESAFIPMVDLRKTLSAGGLVPSVKAAVSLLQDDGAWRAMKLPLLPLSNAGVENLKVSISTLSRPLK